MRDFFARTRVMPTPSPALRGLRARAAALLAALTLSGWLLPATAQSSGDCPTPPSMPTAEQIAQAQREARDRGLLWRISRNGRSGFLYGTMHVGKVGWIAPGPKLREALSDSDTIALEIDPSDPLLQRQIARASVQPAPALPDELKRRLNVQRDAVCLQDSIFDRLHPVLQLTTLGMMAARREGLDATFGSEITLAGFGKATGKRVVSLESVERQFAALIPPDLDAAELEALLRSGLDQFEGDAIRRSTRRLANAWERGAIDDFEGYATWCGCIRNDADRRLMARLNDGRNPALADGIAALHARGAKLFAAVGALHMTGEQGLPKLLAQRGFAVERIAFTP
jgi:uncharacterized protein YbaP (TraB family)